MVPALMNSLRGLEIRDVVQEGGFPSRRIIYVTMYSSR